MVGWRRPSSYSNRRGARHGSVVRGMRDRTVRSPGFGGKCGSLTRKANDVDGSSVNVAVYCYASSENDDEPT